MTSQMHFAMYQLWRMYTKPISNSLDTEFIHGHIHVPSCEKVFYVNSFSLTCLVIDVSGSHSTDNIEIFQSWYNLKNTCPITTKFCTYRENTAVLIWTECSCDRTDMKQKYKLHLNQIKNFITISLVGSVRGCWFHVYCCSDTGFTKVTSVNCSH